MECREGRVTYVDYSPSISWPVVLSCPHGGHEKPESVADRQSGCLEPDWESLQLAHEVREAFVSKWGRAAPAYVALTLHREKLDANRARACACDPESSVAIKAWDAYHGSLESALKHCVDTFGFCLLLDIHGQSHRPDVSELGYLITSTDLLQQDAVLDGNPPRRSSVDSLLSRTGCSASLATLIRGQTSMGALMERRGWRCTPRSPFFKE